MKSKNLKWFWHLHHEILCEPLTEPLKNRIKYIKENKPKDEIKLRLSLIKPVKGKLPKAVIKAEEACDKAGKARDKAREAYVKAEEACDKTLTMKSVLKLHQKECGCFWDGKTIFTTKNKKVGGK